MNRANFRYLSKVKQKKKIPRGVAFCPFPEARTHRAGRGGYWGTKQGRVGIRLEMSSGWAILSKVLPLPGFGRQIIVLQRSVNISLVMSEPRLPSICMS